MVGMIMILMVTNSFFRQEDGRGAGAMMAPASFDGRTEKNNDRCVVIQNKCVPLQTIED